MPSQKAQEGGSNDEPTPRHVVFHYLKGTHFRVIHVSGAVGGVSPNGLLEMHLYSERRPIPRQTVFPVKPDGILGEEIVEERDSRGGVVREVEVASLMDLPTARALHEWLGKLIGAVENIEREGRGS